MKLGENMRLIAITILIGLALCVSAGAQDKADPNAAWTVPCGGACGTTRTNQNSAWDYKTDTDIEGRITEYVSSGSFVIRCSRSCEVFFTPDKYTLVESDYDVLVKFNDKSVKQYSVSRSEDSTAYFFSNPLSILRAIRDNGGYMTIQYKPYERTPDTVKYGVWNLPPTILARIAKGEAQSKVGAAKEKAQREKEQPYKDAANDPGVRKARKELCEQGILKGDRCKD